MTTCPACSNPELTLLATYANGLRDELAALERQMSVLSVGSPADAVDVRETPARQLLSRLEDS